MRTVVRATSQHIECHVHPKYGPNTSRILALAHVKGLCCKLWLSKQDRLLLSNGPHWRSELPLSLHGLSDEVPVAKPNSGVQIIKI